MTTVSTLARSSSVALFRAGNANGPRLSNLRLSDTHPDAPDIETGVDATDGPEESSARHTPTGIAAVALAALTRRASRLEKRLTDPSSEDGDLSSIENDLTFIDTVGAFLIRNLREADSQRAA